MTSTATVDFTKRTGKIKAMHAVGQPPYPHMDGGYMHYLTDAHIPYARLHDVGGLFGGNMYVDIPNIFRDFSANEYDPASYDFGFTDELLKTMDQNGVKPIYRLGVTIENFFEIRAYRIFPPADFGKWARICEHIIRHYNDGWANGFHFGIQYWEIWNEPEDGPGSGMWRGTDVEFFRLYEIASKHLKQVFGDTIKVGGYASCGLDGVFQEPAAFGLHEVAPRGETYRYYFVQYAEKFFSYIRAHNCPLDFFSWHCYINTDSDKQHCHSIRDVTLLSRAVDYLLKKYGFDDTERQLNEWNNAWELRFRGTAYAAANAAAMMLAMQDTNTDMLCYYDARIGESCFGGMFNPLNYTPLPVYYAFQAFGELYARGVQVKCSSSNDDLYVQAAVDANGANAAVMLSNLGEDTEVLLPGCSGFRVYTVDAEHALTPTDEIREERFLLQKNQVALLLESQRETVC